jgi:CRISPR/Cas system-associated exonuclease Cas4 (RecB family)
VSRTVVIEPAESVVETVITMIGSDSADYSQTAIVFPGKRPAHFVRKAIGKKLNRSFIPPKIFSIDEFVGYLYQQLDPGPLKQLEPIDAVALLFEVHSTVKEKLGGSGFDTLDAFLPVGFRLFGELEELRAANLSDHRVTEALSGLSFARLHSLPDYYAGFYRLVRDRGYCTRSMQYNAVAERCHTIGLAEFSSVIVTGFLALTNSEQQILAELRRRDNLILVYQRGKGLTDHFKRLRIDAAKTEGTEQEIRPEVAFYNTQDTHGQVFALATLMKEKLERGEQIDERTVIVLPTPEALFPVYHQALPLFQPDQYNIALGYPVSRTPMFGFLNSLMDLVETTQQGRFPASAYLNFVLHPYTKNIRFGQRSDVTRILFHVLEENLIRDKSRMFATLEEIESLDELFADVPFAASEADEQVAAESLKAHLIAIHDKTIRQFSSFESVADFARKAIGVLLFVYGESTASLHPMFRAYAETILEMFHGLEGSIIGKQKFRNAQAYFNFLRRYVTMCEVPFSGTPLKGLQVLGLLETRNLRFDDVYVLDVNDNVLPGGTAQQMLLPQGLREHLGLETQRDRERLTEYYFGLLINGAKKVHLFFTEQNESEKSRFIERLLWERQRHEGLQRPLELIRHVRYAVNLGNSLPGEIDKSPDVGTFLKNFSFSASALDMYLKCPIKFYYAKVLGLEEKEDAADEVENRDIGQLVHAVLREYFHGIVGKKLTQENLDQVRMERVVDETFREHFGNENAGVLYLIKRQVVRQMQSFLKEYQAPKLEETQIAIEELEYSISARAKGFTVAGRIDRIERRGTDTFILDYKTGKDDSSAKVNFRKLDPEERETWSSAITSLQLPFYLLLYTLKTGTEVKLVRPAYIFLGRNSLSTDIETEFAEDPNERAENFRKVENVIFQLMEEITDPSVPFRPTADPQKHCPDCAFSVLCGTQWVQGWTG